MTIDTTTIDTNAIADTNSIILDTNVRNLYLNGLKKFYAYIVKKEYIDEKFFKEILPNRISPLSFVKWDLYDKKLFEETIILIFLKMYNPDDITPCENNLSYRSETNPYLLFMLYKYYEMSKEDPANIPLLGRVVGWIVYEYDTKGNIEIENEILKIKKKYNKFNSPPPARN